MADRLFHEMGRRAAGLHERTGYPLLHPDDEAERVIVVLGGERLTCTNCWWAKGGHGGAPWADGASSTWMDARCERRYVEMMDAEYERDPQIPNFGPGYSREHRADGACGAPPRDIFFPPRTASSPDHERWWRERYPRLGMGNRLPDHPACIHWRARRPELAKIAAGGRGADIAALWAEFDATQGAVRR